MLTDRQRSFIAEVTAARGTLHFLDKVIGQSKYTAEQQALALCLENPETRYQCPDEAYDLPEDVREEIAQEAIIERAARTTLSHYLCYSSEDVDVPPLRIYFRYVDNAYRLFVRSEHHFGKALFFMEGDGLGAFKSPHDGEYSTLFSLLQPNNARLDFNGLADEQTVRIALAGKTRPLQLRKNTNPYFQNAYVSTEGHRPLQLKLKVIEINVPYLDNPDEV